MIDPPPRYAPGDILRRFNLTRQRFNYIIESRHILPAGRVGNAHVYDAAALVRIERAITEIDTRRNAPPHVAALASA